MKFTALQIPDVILVEPDLMADDRGYFFESYHQERFAENGIDANFVQDNQSLSRRGVLRGLHYQLAPFCQGKLVRAIKGAIFDVAVDIRRDSPTLGRWVGEYLNTENKRMLYMPPGFAHGLCALEDGSEVLYKVTKLYSRGHERGLKWDDPAIGIVWPDLGQPYFLSAKDAASPGLKEIILL